MALQGGGGAGEVEPMLYVHISTPFPLPWSHSQPPFPSPFPPFLLPTFDQPGKEAAVADEGLPLHGVPVHVLQVALLGTRVSGGEGGGGASTGILLHSKCMRV